MLYEICRTLRNYFDYKRMIGEFEIKDGILPFSINIDKGQYIRIIGSKYNDGIFKYGEDELKDEAFSGAIWLLTFPREFLETVSEIETFQTSNKDKLSPYTSESFGGYSYSKASADVSWKTVFASRLNAWRKL